jgi:NADH:ubiquinone oxidoreductase subunit H
LFDIIISQSEFFYFHSLFPVFFINFVLIFLESNRIPFDLPEAEAELVAGYNVEYFGIVFSFFFLAEYSNMLFLCSLIVIFFFGGFGCCGFGFFLFFFKIYFFLFFFILVRSSFPRIRYDQMLFVC